MSDEPFKSQIPEWCAEIASTLVRTYGFDTALLEGAIAGALHTERESCAKIVEDNALSRSYAGGPHGGGYLVKRTNPSWSAQVIAAAIRSP